MTFLDSTSHVIQLLVALSGALIIFIMAYTGYARALFIGLIVMIPFQPIESKYGSINMAVTYVVGFAMLLNNVRYKGKISPSIPLIVPFSLLIFTFLLSWSMAPKLFSDKYFWHLIIITSNVVLFYMSYSFFTKEKDLEIFFKALITSNVLVIAYCLMQVLVGYGKFSLLGINELGMIQNRQDQRLAGPFHAVGITAEYIVIQSLLIAHYIVHASTRRWIGYLILVCNFAILVGTGNRGGFISALLAALMFLYFYRKQIGRRGVMLAGSGFAVMIVISSYLMIAYTDFNVLYTRLIGTEIEGVTPDTRQGWGYVADRIAEDPVIGHGPRIVRTSDFQQPPREWPAGHIRFWPHNLYLYILYTTGILGFIAYASWAATYWNLLNRVRRRTRDLPGIGYGLATLGMIVLAIVLIDQIKVEFLRSNLLDYQHYLAALFGMFASLHKIEHEE